MEKSQVIKTPKTRETKTKPPSFPKAENINQALSFAQAELLDVVADLENAHFRSKYVSLGALLKAVRPVLAKHGLAIVTTVWPTHTRQEVVVRGSDGTVTETTALERDGHQIEAKLLWSGDRATTICSAVHCPKQASVHAFASFHTYARRWLIQGLCGVGVDLDDDGNAASTQERAKVQGNQELKQRVR